MLSKVYAISNTKFLISFSPPFEQGNSLAMLIYLEKEGKRKCMRKTNLARAIPRRGV